MSNTKACAHNTTSPLFLDNCLQGIEKSLFHDCLSATTE